jgi:acetylornithine deacetylase
VADYLKAAGFTVERVAVADDIADKDLSAGYPPLSYDGRTCVAARVTGHAGGRSMHLSGHVDVVPAEREDRWTTGPWAGAIRDGRIYGRGAGDMKGGLAAYLIAAAAFLEVVGQPAGDLLFSSVIEEECTGNGMKAVLAAGYEADATLIGEPSGLQLQHAGVGVVWARLTARSSGAHPAFSSGSSVTRSMLAAVHALEDLEAVLNAHGTDRFFHEAFEQPYRLNVGAIHGGAWPSSEPVEMIARVRLGFGRDLSPATAQRLIASRLAEVAPDVDVDFEGFRADAYVDDLDHPLAAAVIEAHETIHGTVPSRRVLAGTTDARSVKGPCLCYGPSAGSIHGVDEWVDLASAHAVARCVALVLGRWQAPVGTVENG